MKKLVICAITLALAGVLCPLEAAEKLQIEKKAQAIIIPE